MPPRQTRAPTTDNLLPPILDLLAPPSPNPYSAHQKALTTVARIASSAPAVAVEICFATARELLKLGEGGSGVELGVRGLGILEGTAEDMDEKTRAAITQLLALTPSAGPWRKKLADAAIKYSAHAGECPSGDPALQHYIGELYYKDRQFAQAESHLLASHKRDSAITLAEMLFEWSEKGTLDPGPYAVRGVLPYLTHQPPSILPAASFLSHFLYLLSSPTTAFSKSGGFTTTHPSPADAPFPSILVTASPTLNFLQLAIITIQRAPAVGVSGVQARGTDGGVGREWEALVHRYRRVCGAKGVLAQNEVLEAIAQISTNVFLIPPPRGQQPDMLQNLMGMFGGGGR
ncbi:uncharacterized protein MKK02DRAFT_38167 [Dioszegia hungarica]|uniref:Cytoplasmic protein n=1 Tax=Dioszegia hungarica TaxID=4972 RepID=A0AA38H6L4_9TREE|nr:uncharacterized protein MKK02DRAFT_38167 [Dioszegia hungarica]KAI9633514.1 hypothetical protein MKK02DRAFT_38167 [Dioszegia hungarica]